MITEWKWRIYLFVRSVDATPENKNALASIYPDNGSGETLEDELKMFLSVTSLSQSGNTPAQAFGINAIAKTSMRDDFKNLLDGLTDARYAAVASVPVSGYAENELVLTNFDVIPNGQIVSWEDALEFVENEFGLQVIEPIQNE